MMFFKKKPKPKVGDVVHFKHKVFYDEFYSFEVLRETAKENKYPDALAILEFLQNCKVMVKATIKAIDDLTGKITVKDQSFYTKNKEYFFAQNEEFITKWLWHAPKKITIILINQIEILEPCKETKAKKEVIPSAFTLEELARLVNVMEEKHGIHDELVKKLTQLIDELDN